MVMTIILIILSVFLIVFTSIYANYKKKSYNAKLKNKGLSVEKENKKSNKNIADILDIQIKENTIKTGNRYSSVIKLGNIDYNMLSNEEQDHTLRQVVHLSSNNFPKSKKIYVSFDEVILYNENKGNPITIKNEDHYELEFDISKQLNERKSIEYISNNNSNLIEEAKLTNSGFAVTKNPEFLTLNSEEFIVKDNKRNIYTLSYTLRILNKEDLSKNDKKILIFCFACGLCPFLAAPCFIAKFQKLQVELYYYFLIFLLFF